MTERPRDPHLREIDPYEGLDSGPPPVDPERAEELDEATIQRRATQGVGFLGGQMLALQVLTLGITVALARLLTVSDYGVFAIALAVQQAGLHLVELGVPAALINRKNLPDAHEQKAITGFVLVLALGFTAAVAAVGYLLLPALGVDENPVKQATIACLALPILALRTVPTVLLERRLRYGRVTALHSADTITFNLAALGGALAGWGSFALVAGVPAGALAGLIAAVLLQTSARGISWDFGVVRPLIAFGSQVGLRQGIVLTRDLAFVSLISLVGSQTAAGFFAMSQRVLMFPLAISLALARVGFPAMARSDGDDERVSNAISSIGVAAVGIGLPLAVLAGSAEPLLDFLFGSRWTPAADVVIPSAAGLFLMASAGSLIGSLFYSLGDARTPLIATIIDSAVLCASVLFLVQWNDTTGVGIAVFLGALTGVLYLFIRVLRPVKATGTAVLKGVLITGLAAAAGIFSPMEGGLVAVVVAAGLSSITWLLLTSLFSFPQLKLIFSLVRRSLSKKPETQGSNDSPCCSSSGDRPDPVNPRE